MSLCCASKHWPVVLVGGQVTAAAAQKVTWLTEQLQGLLSVRTAHEGGARIWPRAYQSEWGRGWGAECYHGNTLNKQFTLTAKGVVLTCTVQQPRKSWKCISREEKLVLRQCSLQNKTFWKSSDQASNWIQAYLEDLNKYILINVLFSFGIYLCFSSILDVSDIGLDM